ncbi:MAG: hypothetical protein V3V09_04575 [Arenicellales bacterium]
MSKKKNKHRSKAQAKNQAALKPVHAESANKKGVIKGIIILSALAIVGAAMFMLGTGISLKTKPLQPKIVLQQNYQQGGVYQCRRNPAFIAINGLRQPVAVDTKQSRYLGPVFRELRANGRLFRDESWAEVGHVGPVVFDRRGNMYVIPVPAVSLDVNPLEKQNRVYKVDSKTAKLSVFAQLPNHERVNARNPFGVLGITYDCETDSLYVSSVAGSEPNRERGVIYQLNIKTGEVLDQLQNVDAIGLGAFNYAKQKRLFYGSARNSGVYSVRLNKQGGFGSDVRYEFALNEFDQGNSTKAKKIRFRRSESGKHLMVVSELAFDFRLFAETASGTKKYIFEYDSNQQKWVYTHFEWE